MILYTSSQFFHASPQDFRAVISHRAERTYYCDGLQVVLPAVDCWGGLLAQNGEPANPSMAYFQRYRVLGFRGMSVENFCCQEKRAPPPFPPPSPPPLRASAPVLLPRVWLFPQSPPPSGVVS